MQIAPQPSSLKLFRDRIRVSIPPFGAEEIKVDNCLAPSHPILLFVRSKDLILAVPLRSLTMASILSSVRLLLAKFSFSEIYMENLEDPFWYSFNLSLAKNIMFE